MDSVDACDFSQIGQPGLNDVVGDQRFCDVVDDGAQVGHLVHHLRYVWQVGRPGKEIEREVVSDQLLQAVYRSGICDPSRVFFRFPDMTDTYEVFTSLKFVEGVSDLGVGEIDPADDASDKLVFLGQFQQPPCLVGGRHRLDYHGVVDTGFLPQEVQVPGAVVGRQRASIWHPGIIKPVYFPEVVMTVYHRHRCINIGQHLSFVGGGLFVLPQGRRVPRCDRGAVQGESRSGWRGRCRGVKAVPKRRLPLFRAGRELQWRACPQSSRLRTRAHHL